MNKIDLVILAGGKGTRIKKYLGGKPKPMLKFNGKFFLDYIIDNFSKYDFNKIYILTGFKSKIIFKNYNNKIRNFTKIICIKESKPLGTGGALSGLKGQKINDFVLINGDTIFDINIKKLIKSLKKNSVGAIGLTNKKKYLANKKLSSLSLNKGLITYKDKSMLMNGGVYFFRKKFINLVSERYASLENDLLPKLIKTKKISGKIFKNFFLDIGHPKILKKTHFVLKKYFNRPSAFLDRDGVINYDYGYVYKFKDFKFKPQVLKVLNFLQFKKYNIFIVTNQAGIAKGFFKESDFTSLHLKIKKYLYDKDIFINDVKYSPYHPQGVIKKYKKYSALRKPNNLMIKKIIKKWNPKMKKSFMIGDKISDQKAAQKSNIYFEFVNKNFFSQIKKINRKLNNY